MQRNLAIGLLVVCCSVGGINSVFAQGLIWSLPEDGTEVRYEGTMTQVEFRPDSVEGDLEIEWIRHLTLKSVGTESAEYNGQTVPCRWIEIKVETGKPSETGVETGPAGARIYKVLVPESRVIGKQLDADEIPVSFLPIVKGYRRIGEDQVRQLNANVLQVYPVVSLVMHYETLKAESESEEVDIPLESETTPMARRFAGEHKMENRSSRSLNEAVLWMSDDIPFGLAKWRVRMLREAKDSSEPRGNFKQVSEVTVEMSAHEIDRDAQSEVVVP